MWTLCISSNFHQAVAVNASYILRQWPMPLWLTASWHNEIHTRWKASQVVEKIDRNIASTTPGNISDDRCVGIARASLSIRHAPTTHANISRDTCHCKLVVPDLKLIHFEELQKSNRTLEWPTRYSHPRALPIAAAWEIVFPFTMIKWIGSCTCGTCYPCVCIAWIPCCKG